MTPTPSAAGPPPGSEEPPASPELPSPSILWPTLDRLGLTQAIGGLVLGLIALFSSYDHITLAGRSLPLQQQWGIPLILASVATVVVDAQLATRSRLRAAQDAARAAHEAALERDLAAEARERQARDAQRQNEELALLRRSVLLSGRVQLDRTPTNRARFQFFLTLLAQSSMGDPALSYQRSWATLTSAVATDLRSRCSCRHIWLSAALGNLWATGV